MTTIPETCIEIFNKEKKNIIIEDCKLEKCYKYCNHKEYDNKIVNEYFDINEENQNIFFNNNNTGRFGNYIYGALWTIIPLFILENLITNNSYETIKNKIKINISESTLYSTHNCRYYDDKQSRIKNKYYFGKKNIEAFKYFKCHHFSEKPFEMYEIDNDNLIEPKLTKNKPKYDFFYYTYFGINKYENDKICFIFEGLFFYYLFTKYGFNLTFENLIQFMAESIERTNNLDNNEEENFKNFIKDYTHEIPDDVNFFQKVKIFLTNELKSCYYYNNIKKPKHLIRFMNIYSMHDSKLNILIKNNYELLKNIKEIIMPDDNNDVKNLYNAFSKKYEEYNLTLIHFRGGDFEKNTVSLHIDNNKDFGLLKPKKYLENINELLSRVNNGKKFIFLCCFYNKDLIFYAYINIIQFFFKDKIIIKIEDDVFKEFPIYQHSIKEIFSDETKHTTFMSLFPYMITSNSSYSHFSANLNININPTIIYNNLYNNHNENNIKMNFYDNNNNTLIEWDVIYVLYYAIYNIYMKNNNQITIKLLKNKILNPEDKILPVEMDKLKTYKYITFVQKNNEGIDEEIDIYSTYFCNSSENNNYIDDINKDKIIEFSKHVCYLDNKMIILLYNKIYYNIAINLIKKTSDGYEITWTVNNLVEDKFQFEDKPLQDLHKDFLSKFSPISFFESLELSGGKHKFKKYSHKLKMLSF